MTDRTVSRRALLGSAGAGVFALYAAGCGTSSKLPPAAGGVDAAVHVPAGTADPGARPGPQGDRRPPRRQGAQRLGFEGNSYDPAIGWGATGWDSICNLLFAPLYSYGASTARRSRTRPPRCRTSAQTALVYTIPLRQDVLLPPRPQGRRGRLQVRLGARARPQARELGGELHLLDQGRERALRQEGQVAHRRQGRRRLHARGDARRARRDVPLRAHAAVLRAGAARGRREVRQELLDARRRQRPVQRSRSTTRRASACSSSASRATSGRACRTSTRSSTAGASTRPSCC